MNITTSLLHRLARRQQLVCVPEDRLANAAGQAYLKRLVAHFDFDFVFDIGANVGQYASMLRNQAGYRGPMVSVEPLPEVVRLLKDKARDWPEWTIHEAALDDVAGTARFNVMAGSEFSSLLAPSAEFEGKFSGQQRVETTIEVKVETLATLFAHYKARYAFKRPLLKLDTQGNELRVLAAATEAMAQTPAIQIEVGFKALYEGAPGFEESIAFMASRGFELSGLFANNRGHFPRLLEMDAVFVRSDLLQALA